MKIKLGILFLLSFALSAVSLFSAHGLQSPTWVASLKAQASGGSPPDAPPDLTVVDSFPTWVLVSPSWPTADGLELGRSTDGGGETIVGGFVVDNIVDTGHSTGDGHSYAYRVRATNAFGASAWVGPVYTVWTYNNALNFYWQMEESAGTPRNNLLNGGYADFVETGGTVAQAAGKNNNAASFSSVGGHYLATTGDAFGTGVFDADFSISFWIYCTALPIGVNNQILVRQAAGDVSLVLTTAGNLLWQVTTDYTDASAIKALGSLNAWHFVVVTATSSTTSISVDGATWVSDPSGSPTLPSGDDYLYLCSPFGMLLTLNGRIDELAIYSSALAQADVTVLYAAGTGIFR